MKKTLTRLGYVLGTAFLLALMFVLPNKVTAAGFDDNITVHLGQTHTERYTVNAAKPVFVSQNTSIVTVTQAAVSVAGIPEGFTVTEVSYIPVTPGAASVLLTTGGQTATIHIFVQDHIWNPEYTVDDASTCTTHGHESRYCTVSGCAACMPGSTRELPLAPHTWSDLMITDVEPTYFKPGSESYHCTVCGAINEDSVEPIPKLRLDRAKIKSLKNPGNSLTVLKMAKMEGPSGFTIQYGLKKDFSDAKTHYTKAYKVRIKNLRVGKTYYFRVKATLKKKNKKVHGRWSKTKSIKITG